MPTAYPYINYLTCGSPLPSVSSATHVCSTRFLQHGLGLLAHMILTQSQVYFRPPAYPKEEVNLSTLHEEWGVNTAPQEIFITFSPLLSISSAKHSTRFLQHGSGSPQLYPYLNYLTCGSPLLSVSSAAHACSTRFLQHGLGLLAHMILTQSQAYIRPPAYPKEEVNLSTLYEEWGVNTAPQEFIITFSPLLSISSAKHSTRFLQHGSGHLQFTHTQTT